MSCESTLCHLRRQIADSLRPYTGEEEFAAAVSLTKEKEKDVLIALSLALREIQQCTLELEVSDSDQEADRDGKRSCGGSELRSNNCNCLIMVLADFMLLLGIRSRFVQHSAGNFVLALSKFVAAASEHEWDSFISLLFVCLELAITHVLLCSVTNPKSEVGDPKCDSSGLEILKSKLKNATWSTAAGIVHVLRTILKDLKRGCDKERLQVYFGSANSILLTMPWDILDETQVGQTCIDGDNDTQRSLSTNALFDSEDVHNESKFVFLGNIVQLLCSLVEQSSTLEVESGSKDPHPVLNGIIRLVPKLFFLCLGKPENCKKTSYMYFKHKLLMLVLRLSYQTQVSSSTLISWLQLLQDYFTEVLRKPLNTLVSDEDGHVEGSPFVPNFLDGDAPCTHSLHLQQQALLLFLRCCFSLISLSENTSIKCRSLFSYPALDIPSDQDNCSADRGLLELYKWLQGHLPTDMFVDQGLYLEKCIDFASSFLQLYMHEDDALFKVLLELLRVPFCSEQQLHGGKWRFTNMEDEIFFHVSNIFDPIHLFHLFLAELHYDHQVLLDYLISKDTGISCAEYLLRCLRIVCDSWNSFVEFSMDGKITKQMPCKKRKTVLGRCDSQSEPSSVTVDNVITMLEEEHERCLAFQCGCNQRNIERWTFNAAKDCLLSLKHVIENLHHKNLFPYNPQVLLKRLTKIEELCFK